MQAINREIQMYSTTIPEAHWAKLAGFVFKDDDSIPNDDEDSMVMLTMRTVLEYLNGGDEESFSEAAEPWYRVNPVVRELQKVKRALARLENPPPAPSN